MEGEEGKKEEGTRKGRGRKGVLQGKWIYLFPIQPNAFAVFCALIPHFGAPPAMVPLFPSSVLTKTRRRPLEMTVAIPGPHHPTLEPEKETSPIFDGLAASGHPCQPNQRMAIRCCISVLTSREPFAFVSPMVGHA